MRKSILLLLLGAGACDAASDPGFVVIEDFSRRAVAATCHAVDLGHETVASELRLATDTTWTLLDGPGLQVLTFDDRLALLTRTPLPAEGPGAARGPTSVGLLGDTALAVMARGGLRLVILSLDGREVATEPLDFIPHSVETTGSGAILVTPTPFGTRPPTLLMRFAPDPRSHGSGEWEAVAVPRRHYEDMTVNALGNTALVESLSDGSVLVVHQFLEPRAFRVSAAGVVERLPVPTPDGTRSTIRYLPRSPLTEEQFPRMLLPAMAMSVDPRSSEVYLLTRSGGDIGGHPERAVLRLTGRLEFLAGYTLPVRAGNMVYLPRRNAVLVTDDEDRFHLCRLPRSLVDA